MEEAWSCVSANVVKKAHDAYERHLKEGKVKDEALELCSQERFVAAKVHTTGYMFRCVYFYLELLGSGLGGAG